MLEHIWHQSIQRLRLAPIARSSPSVNILEAVHMEPGEESHRQELLVLKSLYFLKAKNLVILPNDCFWGLYEGYDHLQESLNVIALRESQIRLPKIFYFIYASSHS